VKLEKDLTMIQKTKCTLKFTFEAVKWIKKYAGTLSDYEVSLIKMMLQHDKEKITKERLRSVYFTATHDEEIEQVLFQQSA